MSEWQWWTDALAGNFATIHDGEPQTGYYKVRRKGRDGHLPVAYWRDSKSGEQRCHMDGEDFDAQRALEIWPYASKNPVTAEAYGERLRAGKWPGESLAVIGHNAAPVGNGLDAIKDRIEDLAREAERLIAAGGATSEEISDQASDLANTFGELEGQADKSRIEEKEPHLTAGRVVDTRWRPLIERAAELNRRLKAVVVTPFLRKKEEERQKQAAAAIATGTAPEALPQTRTTAGSSKRPTALRTVKQAEVTDWAVLIAHLKDHPEIRDAAQRIANASAKAGIVLPGMTIKSEKVAA